MNGSICANPHYSKNLDPEMLEPSFKNIQQGVRTFPDSMVSISMIKVVLRYII